MLVTHGKGYRDVPSVEIPSVRSGRMDGQTANYVVLLRSCHDDSSILTLARAITRGNQDET